MGALLRYRVSRVLGNAFGEDIQAKMKALATFLLTALLAGYLSFGGASAQDLSALARLDPQASAIRDAGQGMAITLGISRPVPWRVRVLDNPPRLVMDFREVDWTGIRSVAQQSDHLVDLRAGVFRPGWSRLVIEMDAPLLVKSAEMRTGGDAAQLLLQLEPASAEAFAEKAAQPEPPEWALPVAADLPRRDPVAEPGPLVVVLDPGHGGIDPGAERDGTTEAVLMLTFARELKEAFLRAGDATVVLTREDDVFVPLETRISIARAAGATIFLALHADSLAEGEAVGATIYTLADDASDAAAATLAERHNRDDLLSGVDLTGQDDLVASVLMDMARNETTPRTDALADHLVTAMRAGDIRMHRIPRQEARFSVLKSPDIPSVLVELGFLSSSRDLARLTDPAWRARMAQAIVAGVKAWAIQDEAQAQLRRQ